MTDLTKITTPFGLLDAETQKALKEHGGPFQVYTGKCWQDISGERFYSVDTYRVRPEPPKPREWWIRPCVDGYGAAYQSLEGLRNNYGMNAPFIHVQEVIE